MSPELTVDERLAWVWTTVETLATLFDNEDEQLTYLVFEPLDIDVGSALSEANVTALAAVGVLTEPLARSLIALGVTVTGLIRRAHERGEYNASSLRQSAQWTQVVVDCLALLERRRG